MTPSPQDLEHCRKILQFWHGVEFFLPFDLQGQVLEGADPEKARVLRWSAEELANLGPESAELWRVSDLPADKKIIGFSLFLGKFDRSAITEAARLLEPGELTKPEVVDEAERGEDLEGATCFARISVNAAGEPNLGEISVSTLPWALGRLRQSGIAGLRFDTYRAAIESLKGRLQNFINTRRHDGTGDRGGMPPLIGEEVNRLLHLFYEWAGFEPDTGDGYAVVVRASLGENKEKPGKATALSVETQPLAPMEEEESEEEDTPEEQAEVEIDILNSFYGADIEDILERLPDIGAPLLTYLIPGSTGKTTDLYSSEAQARVTDALHPGQLPLGRWFDEPTRAMSLLQQFAINQALGTQGLFSVNGPPGTGKTTLLRDIFAQIIAERCRILAGFDKAKSAFDGTVKVRFARGEERTVSRLRPELTGFEMVVASSNNAAVNNISQDLPKSSALGEAAGFWRGRPEGSPAYLQEIAHKIAAQTGESSFGEVRPDDIPWGLMSCALGNRTNRRAFVRGFQRRPQKVDGKLPRHYDATKHKTVWEWRDSYAGLSFGEAKQNFLAADAAVRDHRQRLADYADARSRQRPAYWDDQRATAENGLAAVHAEVLACRADDADFQARLQAGDQDLTQLREIGTLLREARPGLLQRLTRPGETKSQQHKLAANRRELADKLQEQRSLRAKADGARLKLQQTEERQRHAQTVLERIEVDRQSESRRIEAHKHQFPKAESPVHPQELLSEDWQISGIWSDDALNRARSELFSAALTLQEAWLAEVLRARGGFGGNVLALCDLLNGGRLEKPEHEILLWQSLFMIVPVVSTTFASIKNQFGELGGGAIGWLFIDEAGQAVPQAAVGALWRAKRAIVVGDPRQIEPVFTVPIRFIRALATSYGLAEDGEVAPHRASVQSLADAGNPLGAWLQGRETGKATWVGSPLRVHRRCVDPMFSVANAIAYEDRMVFGRSSHEPPATSIDLGDSAWVDIRGPVSQRQMVQAEIDLVAEALYALSNSLGALPPLYIISPFKRIKQGLQERLRDTGWWRATAGATGFVPKARDLQDWCSDRIGTVHTFQGKEQDIVWMVLGCDETTTGAIDWACAKPNLLNVALTRARHRVFLIGNWALWGNRPHFSLARDRLARIEGADLIARCRSTKPVSDASAKEGFGLSARP